MIKEADLVRALAEQVGLEFVDLADYQIDPASRRSLLPEALARRYRALPDRGARRQLLVAMSDPANVYALDDIRTITGRDVLPVVATADDVEAAIQKYAGMDSQVEAMASIVADASEEDEDEPTSRSAVEDAPIVKLVNAIMTQAVGDRASDVHIEPRERDVRDPLPRRRRAARADAACAEEHPGRADQPSEGDGRPQHRREAGPAGRAHPR